MRRRKAVPLKSRAFVAVISILLLVKFNKRPSLTQPSVKDRGWPQRLSFSRIDLMVATISERGKHCTPGISPGHEWCVAPVYGLRRQCELSWSRLLDKMSPSIRNEITQNANFEQTFRHRGALNAFDDVSAMTSIYSAHISAIQSLCAAAQTNAIRYGVVLESDARKLKTWRKEDILAVLLMERNVSIFNLAPTTDICKDNSRLIALMHGRCFQPHELHRWGAVAVAYDLTRICSNEFINIHSVLQACVPTDIGLFSGSGGYIAADSTVSYFTCEADSATNETHAVDEIHQELKSTNEHNDALMTLIQEMGHDCAGVSRVIKPELVRNLLVDEFMSRVGCNKAASRQR